MNPWGAFIIALGILLIYLGVKGNLHSASTGLSQAAAATNLPGINPANPSVKQVG